MSARGFPQLRGYIALLAAMLVTALPAFIHAAPADGRLPLFDAHLHYTREDARSFGPGDIVATLQRHGVKRAAVTAMPPEQALALHELAPDVIVPVLGVYRSPGDKRTWTEDAGLPGRVASTLEEAPWRAIGELHLFAQQRHSPVFLQLVDLAERHGLPLLLHCDPAVIDSLYAHNPRVRVIWAHAGAYPYPPLLRDYLDRYPRLSVDLSVRDALIAPGGEPDPGWERLLWDYPDRFLAGVDTFSTRRWRDYGEATERIRTWLARLPETMATGIAWGNAARVFAVARMPADSELP